MIRTTVISFFKKEGASDANHPVELPPGGPTVRAPPVVPNPESTPSTAAIVDVAGPLPEGLLKTLGAAQVTMLTRLYALRASPQQFLDRT
jgi:hypothetical protein